MVWIVLVPVTSFFLKRNSTGVLFYSYLRIRLGSFYKKIIFTYGENRNKETMSISVSAAKTEDSTKSGLNNKENLIHHVSRILL